MKRLMSISDFEKWRASLDSAVDSRESVVTICGGTGCTALGSAQVYEAFEQQIDKQDLAGRVGLKRTGCHGFCEKGPVVVILPDKFFYPSVQVEDVEEILTETVVGRKPIDRLLYVDPSTGKKVVYEQDVPFYAGQQRNVFRYNG